MVKATQMAGEQGDRPHRRAVAELQGVAADLPKNTHRSHWRSGSWPPAARGVLASDNLMRGKIAGDPGVDRLQTDPSNKGDFRDGPPLSNQQYGLHSLKHAFIACVFQRFLEPLLVVPTEAKFGWTLCSSHAASLALLLHFSKNFC